MIGKEHGLTLLLALSAGFVGGVGGQDQTPSNLDKIYRDESHCLVAPEIRKEGDRPISCWCRDALTDARYIYQTYLLTEKDRNLNGTYLTLWEYARKACGDGYDVLAATQGDWRWNGPDVTRTYPPDSNIEPISPDSKGFRAVNYEVRLVYRDAHGRVTKVETFSATEKLPPDFKGHCPGEAVCPK